MECEAIMDEMKPRTDFLFAKSSFLSGMARALDLFGVFDRYNLSRSAEEADARAIASDWQMVGQDLRVVMNEVKPRVELVQRTRFGSQNKRAVAFK